MTIDPNMFLPTAASGKAAILSDPANAFFTQVGQILGNTVAGTATGQTQNASGLVHFDFAVPDAATTSYTITTPDKIEIVDCICRKSVAGAGNTIQLFNGATAISDAMATAVDKTITRAGTIDPAQNVIAAGANITITATRAAGSMLCNVTIVARRVP